LCSQPVKEPNWNTALTEAADNPRDELNAAHPAQLEEAASDGGGGDGVAASGEQHDFNAGSLDDLGGFTAGEELWSKIRPKTIGIGAPGSVNGQGRGIAATGQGGGGQGVHGSVGSGIGYGSSGGLGSGAGGEPKGGGVGPSRAVVAEKLGGGDYPKRALSQKREGVVGVRAEVLENGHVGRVELQRTSGFADLDNTALAAAKDWRFKPAVSNGEPTSAWVAVNVRYRIGDQQ
jgi:TonB family protein